MKVKVYVGKPMEEQFLKEISIGNGEYTNWRVPKKGEVIILDDMNDNISHAFFCSADNI